MTDLSIVILKRAQKELADLPKADYARIKAAILKLATDPEPPGSLKLSGRPGRRIRCGDYRVIYEVRESERTIAVLHVGHRKDVYR